MPEPVEQAHHSALGFRGLSSQVIGETAVPGPDQQVYLQEPSNGLYFRRSGRLLTTEPEGMQAERIRSGILQGHFFELQRVGSVSRQQSPVAMPERTNPVHVLDRTDDDRFVAIRWLDEYGVHEVKPHDKEGTPHAVTVLSWNRNRLMRHGSLGMSCLAHDRKTRSAEVEDPVLGFFLRAKQAYEAVASAQ